MNILRSSIAMVQIGWHFCWVWYLQEATTAQLFGRGEAFSVDLDKLREHQIGYQLARARFNESVNA